MERQDFTVALLPDGYYLYYRGRMIGGGVFHRSIAPTVRGCAEHDIDEIISGKGFPGYLAVICFQDKMDKRFGRKSFA